MERIDSRLSVAPMMNWTNRHCRVFHRLLSGNTLLYSEMITAAAVIYGDRQRLLSFNKIEHPVALQLGGSDPNQLSEATKIATDFGYDEINLNVGCPSDRVLCGSYGASLMANPKLVAKIVDEMKKASKDIKVSVKCRIGIDDQDPFIALPRFLNNIFDAGVEKVIIHARKAILRGLSPKQNRTIPELKYSLVKLMKKEFPKHEIVINGGIKDLGMAKSFIAEGLDGVMIGREAYYNPSQILLPADRVIFKVGQSHKDMKVVLTKLCSYIDSELSNGTRLNEITRHILGAFNGKRGARLFRQFFLREHISQKAGVEILQSAIDMVCDDHI